MTLKRRRRRLYHRRQAKVGAEPGLLSIDPAATPTRVEIIGYSGEGLVEERLDSVSQIEAHRARWPMLWVNVIGLKDIAVVEQVGDIFGLHRLSLEDVLNVHQRPKVEEYNDYFYIVVRLLARAQQLDPEQVSIFFGQRFVVTFQEREGDCFEPVRHRLRRGKPRIRTGGADFLAYALTDAVVDACFPVVEQFTERLEQVENAVIEHPRPGILEQINDIRHELLTLRRAIWPLREAVSVLQRQESALITAETRIYLRDCYDHTIQLMELVETSRELAGGLTEAYLGSLSIRTGEITKVLTIIATVFIPLTFIAGLYGMNFDRSKPLNMPELGWSWGYPAALTLMAVVATLLVMFFRRRGWIGGTEVKPDRSDAPRS